MTRHAIARAALWALRRVYRVKDSDLAALLRQEAERWDRTAGPDPRPEPHPWVEPILHRLAREPVYLFRLQAAERAQLDILRDNGWVVVRDGVVELTEKGREALGLEGP